MIKSKYVGILLAVLMLIVVIFTVFITYFPNAYRDTSDGREMQYETALFDKNKIMSVEIKMDEESWNSMIENARDEEYYKCDVVINGVTYKNVGIRPKGNSSLSQIASDNTTDRYSFKIEFDHYVKNQYCYGLDKLALNNIMSDSTYMKEYVSYDMMSFMDVATPLYSYADITVNGNTWGFYLAVECVEDSFAQRNYGGDYGKLYKPESSNMAGNQGGQRDNANMPDIGEGSKASQVQKDDGQQNVGLYGGSSGGADLKYLGDDYNLYSDIFDNAVFPSDETDYNRVVKALLHLNNGTDLEKYINVEATLRYFAVNTVLVNFDNYTGSMKHNYYLYEEGGQLSIIPWDFNLSFAGFQMNDATSAINIPIDTPVSGTTIGERPLLGKLLEVEEYKKLYHSYLQEIMDNYFNSGLFEETVTKVDNLISDYVKKDPSAFFTYAEYEKGVKTFTEFGLLRAKSIVGQLEGIIPSTEEEQAENPDALISAENINIADMGSQGGGFGDRNTGGNRNQGFGGEGQNTDKGQDADKSQNTYEGMNENLQFPARGEEEGDGRPSAIENTARNQPPDTNGQDEKIQEGNRQPGMEERRENFGGQGTINEIKSQSPKETLWTVNTILSAISIMVLLVGLLFIKLYKRRRYRV